MWSNPTKETWDSLFIDGTTEIKNADGTVENKSKNWVQETVLSATDYGGSALEQLLHGVDNLPTGDSNANVGTTEQAQEKKPEVSSAAAIPADETVKPVQKSAAESLAELGL